MPEARKRERRKPGWTDRTGQTSTKERFPTQRPEPAQVKSSTIPSPRIIFAVLDAEIPRVFATAPDKNLVTEKLDVSDKDLHDRRRRKVEPKS